MNLINTSTNIYNFLKETFTKSGLHNLTDYNNGDFAIVIIQPNNRPFKVNLFGVLENKTPNGITLKGLGYSTNTDGTAFLNEINDLKREIATLTMKYERVLQTLGIEDEDVEIGGTLEEAEHVDEEIMTTEEPTK